MSADCGQNATVKPICAETSLGVYAAAILIFIPCIAATIYFCRSMSGGMPMPGGWTMSMMWMPMPGQTWLESAVMFMLMWIAMMVAMMLPSFLPAMLRYHHERRSADGRGASASIALTVIGYFFVWSVVGALVYPLGVLLALAAMRWTVLSHTVPDLMGATVMVAGAFQFAPWTTSALSRCRGPLSCVNLQTPVTPLSAWRQGMNCGLCCVTCCFGPTLVLLALGMMNPLVIATVAAVIALEKLLPEPKYVIRLTGICAIATGIAMIGSVALGV